MRIRQQEDWPVRTLFPVPLNLSRRRRWEVVIFQHYCRNVSMPRFESPATRAPSQPICAYVMNSPEHSDLGSSCALIGLTVYASGPAHEAIEPRAT